MKAPLFKGLKEQATVLVWIQRAWIHAVWIAWLHVLYIMCGTSIHKHINHSIWCSGPGGWAMGNSLEGTTSPGSIVLKPLGELRLISIHSPCSPFYQARPIGTWCLWVKVKDQYTHYERVLVHNIVMWCWHPMNNISNSLCQNKQSHGRHDGFSSGPTVKHLEMRATRCCCGNGSLDANPTLSTRDMVFRSKKTSGPWVRQSLKVCSIVPPRDAKRCGPSVRLRPGLFSR